ncbi:MAG: hypothetical protein QM784_07755 [Polyangiaceae bacterium]
MLSSCDSWRIWGSSLPWSWGCSSLGKLALRRIRFLRRLRFAGLEAAVYDIPQPDLASALRVELKNGQIPVLCFADPRTSIEERFAIVGRLAEELATRKLVIVRHRGALGGSLDRRLEFAAGQSLPMNTEGISVINLRTDYELLESSHALESEDAALLGGVKTFLAAVGSSLQVNVTAPLTLLRELFTVRGAGTLIKRGTPIHKVTDFSGLDWNRLRGLLESSFSRSLVPDFFERPLLSAYFEPSYRAAAILEPSPVASVLSKFAVDPVAQGEGMGRDIWQAFVREHPRMIWRARTNNPICSWYTWQCDGLSRQGRWTVYWRGVEASAVPAVVEEMLNRPEDFV